MNYIQLIKEWKKNNPAITEYSENQLLIIIKSITGELPDNKIIITGNTYTRNGWTGFNVYLYDSTNPNWWRCRLIELCPYWNKSRGEYKSNAWGTDRTLEVYLSIGYSLGLNFQEIKQSQKINLF